MSWVGSGHTKWTRGQPWMTVVSGGAGVRGQMSERHLTVHRGGIDIVYAIKGRISCAVFGRYLGNYSLLTSAIRRRQALAGRIIPANSSLPN